MFPVLKEIIISFGDKHINKYMPLEIESAMIQHRNYRERRVESNDIRVIWQLEYLENFSCYKPKNYELNENYVCIIETYINTKYMCLCIYNT